MIIYGSKSKELAKEILTDKCQNCGTQNCIDMHVFQKYAHVFWIPFFPLGKTGVSQCDHCKQVLKLKEMPASLTASYDNLKSQTKTPIWTFIGGAIFGILILFGLFGEIEKSKNSSGYIKHLLPNDILETKTSEGHYTYLKVQDIKSDSVYLRENKEEVLFESGLDKLSSSESSFQEDVYSIAEKQILKKYEDGIILNVIRKKNE
jgi:hypothetical protein